MRPGFKIIVQSNKFIFEFLKHKLDNKHKVYNGTSLDDTDLSGVLGYGIDANGEIDSLVLYKNNTLYKH